ncbi:hypothetical protein HY11_04760 [Hyphomonas pacifica]|nr:hypothetical protein HY11_04760 [Hyphomonas pacifica]
MIKFSFKPMNKPMVAQSLAFISNKFAIGKIPDDDVHIVRKCDIQTVRKKGSYL